MTVLAAGMWEEIKGDKGRPYVSESGEVYKKA